MPLLVVFPYLLATVIIFHVIFFNVSTTKPRSKILNISAHKIYKFEQQEQFTKWRKQTTNNGR